MRIVAILLLVACERAETPVREPERTEVPQRTPGFIGVQYVMHRKIVRVVRVLPNTPADHARIKVDDELLTYDGEELDDPNELSRLVSASAVGHVATLTVQHAGETRMVSLHVAPRPGSGIP